MCGSYIVLSSSFLWKSLTAVYFDSDTWGGLLALPDSVYAVDTGALRVILTAPDTNTRAYIGGAVI